MEVTVLTSYVADLLEENNPFTLSNVAISVTLKLKVRVPAAIGVVVVLSDDSIIVDDEEARFEVIVDYQLLSFTFVPHTGSEDLLVAIRILYALFSEVLQHPLGKLAPDLATVFAVLLLH